VDDDAVFSGVDGPRCPRAPANSPPRALLINKGSASGVFQDDFKNGEVQHSKSCLLVSLWPLGSVSTVHRGRQACLIFQKQLASPAGPALTETGDADHSHLYQPTAR